MTNEQRAAIELIVTYIERHTGVDYNNSDQIKLANSWFEETLNAIQSNTTLPTKPRMLMDRPQ